MGAKDRGITIFSYDNRTDCYRERHGRARFRSNDDSNYGEWTLTEFDLSAPVKKQNIITIPNQSMFGEYIDVANAFTDGITRFENRTLSIGLECSNGSYEDRENWISGLERVLFGMYCRIQPPDFDFLENNLTIYGRITSLAREYSDLAHCKINIIVDAEPYRKNFDYYEVTNSQRIYNSGIRAGIPIIFLPDNETEKDITVTVDGISKSYHCSTDRNTKLYDFPINPGETKTFNLSQKAWLGFPKEAL